MKVERSINAAMRSAGQTIDELSTFTADVLGARSYPSADQVRAQLKSLTPLFNLLLAKRTVADPALTISTPDMQVRLHIDYDMNAAEDLSIPSTALLDELVPNAPVEVTLRVTETIAPDLVAMVAKISGAPARLTLRVVEPAEADAPPAPADEPPAGTDTPRAQEDASEPAPGEPPAGSADAIPQQKSSDPDSSPPAQ